MRIWKIPYKKKNFALLSYFLTFFISGMIVIFGDRSELYQDSGFFIQSFYMFINNENPWLNYHYYFTISFLYGYYIFFTNAWLHVLLISLLYIYLIRDLSLILKLKAFKIICLILPFFMIMDLTQGNINTIICVMLVEAYKKQEKRLPILAGFLAGMAAFKPSVVIILPFFILKKKNIKWKIIIGILIAFLINWVITFIFVNPLDFFIGAKTGLDRELLSYFWAIGIFHSWFYVMIAIIMGNRRRVKSKRILARIEKKKKICKEESLEEII